MATASPKKEWLVLIPDRTEPGTLEKRIKIRPQHLENLLPLHKSGIAPLGGAYLKEHPKSSDEIPKMMGSAMIFVAESEEEVKERLKGDVYTKEGVWDVENAQIWPFRCAIRSGL